MLKKHFLIRMGVVLTALLGLGTAAYTGQVWWARRVGSSGIRVDPPHAHPCFTAPFMDFRAWWSAFPHGKRSRVTPSGLVDLWIECPWYGYRGECYLWVPRRSYFECLRSLSGQSLPNDPFAWKAWLKAHPNLVWDETLKRLVEPTS